MHNNMSKNTTIASRRQFLKQGVASGIALGTVSFPTLSMAQSEPKKKIKALLVTGGGYHDYITQKTILTEGISKLIDVEWTIWHHDNPKKLKEALSEQSWSAPYDIVVYSICHAKEKDANYINSIVNVHKEGKPMVAIHCTMHSYHWAVGGGKKSKEDKEWNKLLGVVSNNHQPKGPAIQVNQTEGKHSSYKTEIAEWKTPKGELYNIAKVYPTATILANGTDGEVTQPVVWVNKYGKANVFATTIGHHNQTMQTPEFLQTIADGMVWAVNESC